MKQNILAIRAQLRQSFFAALLGLFAAALSPMSQAQSIDDVTLDVYKSETCGCCVGWIAHMDESGFASKVIHPRDLDGVKEELGILRKWQSCHTAVTENGYLFEGHIPARYITAFLAAPPTDALGLAVPGMPMGSPGMEIGDQFNAYDVILMKKDGSSEVYAHIASKSDQ